MVNLRPSLFVIGLLLSVLALSMALPAFADAVAGNPGWRVFLASAAVTLFAGVILVLAFRTHGFRLSVRETFVLTTAAWVTIAFFASLPFLFSTLNLTVTDAFFEAMSGLTTTGSTVIVGLDDAPAGILLWRALLQWLGGIGIIVMAIAILPILRVGGMQLFRTESSDQSDKPLPRSGPLAAWIALIYFSLTMLSAAALWIAGMGPFEALCHAMTTLSTGGFSTSDDSIGHFDNTVVDVIVIAGMLAGGMPFALYVGVRRGDFASLWRDSQVRWFLGFCAAAALLLAAWLTLADGEAPLTALRYAAFNAISVITTTGFVTQPYDLWGGFAVTVLFFITFVGGCTGSTSGGIKVFRYQVLFSTTWIEVAQLAQPHAVIIPHFNGKPIPPGVTAAVRGFFFVFLAGFAATALGLSLLGYDFTTSISGAATAIANVGPGLGPVIGPEGNFAGLAAPAKWLLSAAMLLGRLELFTVLVLFMPGFWRG